MNINPSDIDKIIILHDQYDHYDHIGGLWKILEHRQSIPVYICSNFSQSFKDKLGKFDNPVINSHAFQEIDKQIYTTGEIAASYKNNLIAEQALVLKTAKGLVIITGCAHPGIITIIKTVKKNFPQDNIYLVLGGFHLTGASEKEIEKIVKGFQSLKVQMVAPLHCSGDMTKKVFKQYYGDSCISLRVGEKLEI
jgi:7,8-dihydropterin-6-yl-methyl-4-(beta-D-ribofuranosyl)aminobenzene 5'-phosphate synthase